MKFVHRTMPVEVVLLLVPVVVEVAVVVLVVELPVLVVVEVLEVFDTVVLEVVLVVHPTSKVLQQKSFFICDQP